MDQEHRTEDTNTVSEAHVEHSGNPNLPAEMQEGPVRAFDTPMKQAGEMLQDNVPLSPATMPENMPSLDNVISDTDRESEQDVSSLAPTAPTSEGQPERRSRKKQWTIGSGIAAAVIAASSIVGVNLANHGDDTKKHEPPKPDPKQTSQATPSTSPTAEQPAPSQTPDTAPKLGVLPESMKPLQEMTVDEFATQNTGIQLNYLFGVIGGIDNIRDFANDTYRVSQDKRDILPENISENNTPQEILTITAYGERLPFALNGDDRQKVAMAGLENGRKSVIWSGLDDALTKDPQGMTGGAVAYQNLVALPELVSASNLVTNPGADQIYRDLTVKRSDGQTFVDRVYYHTVNYNGQSFGWWTQG